MLMDLRYARSEISRMMQGWVVVPVSFRAIREEYVEFNLVGGHKREYSSGGNK